MHGTIDSCEYWSDDLTIFISLHSNSWVDEKYPLQENITQSANRIEDPALIDKHMGFNHKIYTDNTELANGNIKSDQYSMEAPSKQLLKKIFPVGATVEDILSGRNEVYIVTKDFKTGSGKHCYMIHSLNTKERIVVPPSIIYNIRPEPAEI